MGKHSVGFPPERDWCMREYRGNRISFAAITAGVSDLHSPTWFIIAMWA